MTEMFKIFIENLESIVGKYSKAIYNLQDCSIDTIEKYSNESESLFEEGQRSVSLLYIVIFVYKY